MIRIWDVATGKLYRILIGHNDCVVYACFNTYNTMITSASSDQTVRIWDIESGTCMHILVHDDSVSSSIFNRDGSQVITYSDDSKIMTWDSETGVCLHVFSGSIF